MISLLLRNWKLILDVILVIALVVFLFLWNPFGIFGGGLKLTPTTNMVTEVREIGQLVTSEYYGEVIASIEESRMNRIEEEEISLRASYLYDNLYGAAVDLHDYQSLPLQVRETEYRAGESVDGWKRIIRQSVNRRNIVDKLNYHQFLEDLSGEPLYEDLLEFIWRREYNDKEYQSSARQKEEALFLLYSDVENKRNPTLNETGFTDFYYQNKESKLTREETKKKLAMVGRGWVKAGFDFSTMDDNSFYINEEAGEVHFFGLSAVVLNADINPWFIPEKGIPGFEILDYNGKVDFRDAKKVKQYCIDKLILNAHRADILKNAELHGSETLKNLFSLMTGKEIKKVFFHNDPIIRLSQEISEDELINYYEATLLDSQIVQERIIIDSLRGTMENSYKNQQLANHREQNIALAISRLRQFPFQDLPGTFNYFSKIVYEIAEDSIMNKEELNQLEALRIKWPAPSDSNLNRETSLQSIWFEDSLGFIKEFNLAIGYLLDQGVVAGNVEERTLLASSFTPAFLEENWVRNYIYTHSDSVQVDLVEEAAEPNKAMLDQLYPFQYDEANWDFFLAKKNLWVDSLSAGQVKVNDVNDSTVWVYDSHAYSTIKRLNIPLDKLINPHLLERLKDKELVWVSENLCFIQTDNGTVEALKGPKTFMFTERQAGEMEAFYRHLVKSHENQKNKGPVVRANEWMLKKFENNKPIGKRFSELKSKIMD